MINILKSREQLKVQLEILEGEHLKTAAEIVLGGLSKLSFGDKLIERYAFGVGGRIGDPKLHTEISGIEFENPVLWGAGWDKKGRAIKGLYDLGFAGGDVGTVLPFGQYGNDKPRLWTIDGAHSVGLNRMGFNSPGMEPVGKYLDALGSIPCPIGINVGKNKISPNEHAPWSHATVIRYLYPYADYFVLGVSSPNTKDLRQLQDKGPLRENIQASNEAMDESGSRKPLLIKIDAERTEEQLDDMIEVVLEEGAAGFIAANTYMGSDLKAKYGARWAQEAGGLSGADPDYRKLATGVVRYLYEQAGDRLVIIGAGGVNDTRSALEKLGAGASAVQVVTAIRPTWGKVAAHINKGLTNYLDAEGIASVQGIIGSDTKRGPKN